jgi:2-C-methyl-D-erythritol 2,4-cyclodiphosphate synthase
VLIHAICDALLGAAALGDIGQHFPDSDPAYKGIDSKVLLANVCQLLCNNGWHINNVDAILCMQKPKVAPFIPSMRQALADVMNIDIDNISVKATTTEHLGFEGREEGISAIANVLIIK